MNRVTLFGNVGADPEIRRTQNGTIVANVRLATSERWKDRDGNRQERTEWHTLVIWGGQNGDGLAGVVEKYVSKGSKLLVEGKITTRKWQDQEGNDRYTTEIVVSDLTLAGDGRGNSEGGDRGGENRSRNDQGGYGQRSSGGGFSRDLDDDIPF